MFRKLRRTKNALSEEETKDLLQKEKRGVLAVNGDDGYPFALPVDYYYDKGHEKIYFHGAKSGHKVDSLKKDDKVCFTVYGNETYKEGEWAPFLQSAVVFGRCALVEDREKTLYHVRQLARRFYPSEEEMEEEIRLGINAVQLYEISIEHICGKQIQEK